MKALRRRLGPRSRRVLKSVDYVLHPERRHLSNALRAVGVKLHEVDGWEERRAQSRFVPIATMLHDTGWSGSLDVIVNGRPDLSGPLANLFIAKDGTVNLVAAGCCHHAGPGSSVVLSEIRQGLAPLGDAAARGLAEDISGNRFFYGIEVENRSDGLDPYPDEQLEAVIRACLAIRLLHPRWAGIRELHHREWTPNKQDMRWQGDIRSEVAGRVTAR